MSVVNSIWFVLLMCTADVLCHTVPINDNGILDTTITDSVEDRCDNPDYDTIKGRLLYNYDSFEELYRLPPFAASSSLPKFSRNNDTFFIGTRQECLNLQPVINRDPILVPCAVKEHKCLCRHCLIPHSLRSGPMSYGCQPIRQYIPVMRRMTDLSTEGDGWTYVLEPFVVGCTCTNHGHVFSSRF